MEKRGKFMLMNLSEFSDWLASQHISRTIQLIQQHHTWLPNYASFKNNNHFQLLDSMERSHLERGFAEIAQNLTTFPDGTVAVCRSLDKIPAGIKGANANAICIEHVGNFDQGGDAMHDAHRDCIIRLSALLCKKFSLTPSHDSLVYHHWYDLNTGKRTNGSGSTKSCPGSAFFGGNGLADADAHFIPLVNDALHAKPVPAKPVVKPLYTGTVNCDALNVRASPTAAGKRLKQLSKGVSVSVYEAQTSWLRIHPTQPQWVASRYIRPD